VLGARRGRLKSHNGSSGYYANLPTQTTRHTKAPLLNVPIYLRSRTQASLSKPFEVSDGDRARPISTKLRCLGEMSASNASSTCVRRRRSRHSRRRLLEREDVDMQPRIVFIAELSCSALGRRTASPKCIRTKDLAICVSHRLAAVPGEEHWRVQIDEVA
jgi:hypothetical protein